MATNVKVFQGYDDMCYQVYITDFQYNNNKQKILNAFTQNESKIRYKIFLKQHSARIK